MDERFRRAIASIDALIAELERPLAAADRGAGWDDATRDDWREHLGALRARLARGEPPEHEQYHLMRWLNPIGLGPLAERFSAIQRQLNELYGVDQPEGTTGRETRRVLRELGIERPSRLQRLTRRRGKGS